MYLRCKEISNKNQLCWGKKKNISPPQHILINQAKVTVTADMYLLVPVLTATVCCNIFFFNCKALCFVSNTLPGIVTLLILFTSEVLIQPLLSKKTRWKYEKMEFFILEVTVISCTSYNQPPTESTAKWLVQSSPS